MVCMVVLFLSLHAYNPANNVLNQIHNLVRKSCSKTSQYLVKNHNFWEMDLVDWEEDYQRKDLIFLILIYQRLNIYHRHEKRIELWHSKHKLYHLETMHYNSVLRNQQASLVHLELRSCASQESETWCTYYSWNTYSLNENPCSNNKTCMWSLSSYPCLLNIHQ